MGILHFLGDLLWCKQVNRFATSYFCRLTHKKLCGVDIDCCKNCEKYFFKPLEQPKCEKICGHLKEIANA